MSEAPSKPSGPTNLGPKSRPRRVDKLLGTYLDGKYKILKKIGEGGMGSVYIANQEPIDRKVAVKVLLSKLAEDEIAVKRFEQEARAISKMQHPNTVTIYDYGRMDVEGGGERLYIVMEYLRGTTLTQVLRAEGALPGPRASRILRQVCASLADAHAAGIIHRDLKPDNIFLSEFGGEKDWVKVLDFGVAKLADSESSGTLTQTGMIFGTPKYMSPEQAEGKPIDYRADIYALGVVLYELLCGKPPFMGDTPVALLLKHISQPPMPFVEVAAERAIDPRLEAIVMRALEKHPDRRQQEVTELAFELEQYERSASGPQAIPTDVGHLPHSGPTGGTGLPTELFPGTMPGQPLTPSDLAPPDHVPPDLSDGLPGAGTATALPDRSSTAHQTARGAPLTAPLDPRPFASAGLDTLGVGLRDEISAPMPNSRPSMKAAIWWGVGTAVVLIGIGLAFALRRPTTVAEALVAPAEDPVVAVGSPPDAGGSETVVPRHAEAVDPPLMPALDAGPSAPEERIATGRTWREPKKVAIWLRSEPEGAVVSIPGQQVGITPVRVDLARSDEETTFSFRKKGYRVARRKARLTENAEIEVRLKRRARPVRKLCPNGRPPPCPKPKAVDPLDLRVDDLK